jgi:ABC-2 type transport system ATP-binding protein
MVEAEELCDRVAIINKGRVLACDTPANLKRNLQRDAIFEIETSPLNGLDNSILAEQAEVKKAALTETEGGAMLELILKDESALAGVINILTQKNVKVKRLTKREPTLEDVFMELVGQRMEDVEMEESPDESK